jgi:hypothetical protein
MKRRSHFISAQPEGRAARTGEHCPETGWWSPAQAKPEGGRQPARFISQGSVMPALGSTAVSWLLLAAQPRAMAIQGQAE